MRYHPFLNRNVLPNRFRNVTKEPITLKFPKKPAKTWYRISGIEKCGNKTMESAPLLWNCGTKPAVLDWNGYRIQRDNLKPVNNDSGKICPLV